MNAPVSWEAAATDSHDRPAVWAQCSGCRQLAWCVRTYAESGGGCQLKPRPAEGGPGPVEVALGCSSCVVVAALCAACSPEQFWAGHRHSCCEHCRGGQPPGAQEGGEGR